MKQKEATALFALLFLVMLFGVGEAFSPYVSRTVPSKLTAQVGGAVSGLPQSEIDVAKKRADDFLKYLQELADKLNALPNPPPPQLPSDALQLVGFGEHEGRTSVSFGPDVPIFTSVDRTFSIKTKAGRPLVFDSLQGLATPFQFKGGTYPGTGGTCAPTITSDCTITLTFLSNGKWDNATEELSRYRQSLKLVAKDRETPVQSNVLVVGGGGPVNRLDGLALTMSSHPFAIILPGESSNLTIRLNRESGTFYFKNAIVTGISAPFSLIQNDCSGPFKKGACSIKLGFSPSTPGEYKGQLSLSIDVGELALETLTYDYSARTLSRQTDLSPEQHMLVVYNSDWPESVEIKNYYLANRPGFASVNTLGVRFPFSARCADLACLSEAIEIVPYSELRNRVVTPIVSWLREHPEKDIQYVVLMRGLPTRPGAGDTPTVPYVSGDPVSSTQALIRMAVAGDLQRDVFVTSLDTGSFESTKRYVDKLKRIHSAMPVKNYILSARGTGSEGTTYYFSDAYAPNFENSSTPAKEFADALKTANPSSRIVQRGYTDVTLTSASDVAGIVHRGIYGYGWNGNYATDGTIRLSGKSSWYLTETMESFNGLWLAAGHQGNFIRWFSANAYGGTEYSYTPVAAVTHVIEPGAQGVNSPYLFVCWESGKPFAYCAWKSAVSDFALQAVGDPWVTR